METRIFEGPDGQQYLVTIYPSGVVNLAVRSRIFDTWSAPFRKVAQ